MNIVKLLLILSSLSLAACGQYGNNRSQLDRSNGSMPTTGFEKVHKQNGQEVRRAYTISGDPDLYNELAQQLALDPARLAQSIHEVQMLLTTENTAPKKYAVEISFDDEKYDGLKSLKFNIDLQADQKGYKGQGEASQVLPQSFTSKFVLDIDCKDKLCSRVTLLLREQSATGTARAGLIYQQRQARAFQQRSVIPDRQASPEVEALAQGLETALESGRVEQKSVVVVNGPAYTEVRVTDKNNQEIIAVKSELLDTSDQATDTDRVLIAGNETTKIETRVTGNNPNTGGLIIDLDDNNTGDGIRLIVRPNVDSATENTRAEDSQTVHVDGVEKHGEFILHNDKDMAVLVPPADLLNDNSVSDVKKITEQLNAYATNPEIIYRAKMWGGIEAAKPACRGCRTPSVSRMRKFLYNMKFAEDVVTEQMLMSDVSPELSYITLIESAFFVRDDFPIQTNPRSSATGPWQFIDGTAEDMVKFAGLPYNVHDIPTRGAVDRAAHLDDPRTKLGTATRLAGNLLYKIRQFYPHDVGLAILGFYQGHGEDRKNGRGVGHAVRRTCGKVDDKTEISSDINGRRYCKYPVTLTEIHEFNMMPDEMTDYAFTVIAARFVGRNPSKYGMTLPENNEPAPQALREKL